MSRPIRYIPERGALVEVTCRTIQARFLLRPSPALNEIVIGVLGRAQRRYEVACHAVVFASNHWHGLFTVDDASKLVGFMNFAASKLAREVARLHEWPDKVWSRRYQAIVVSDEEAAQAGRLKYLLSHGVKEGLVEKAIEWPGVHCVRAILEDEPLQGIWYDRTKEYAARNRGETFERLKYATVEELHLSPLPCWADLPPGVYKQQVAELIEDSEQEAATELKKQNRQPLGVRAVLRQQPHARPNRAKKSPAPLIHAATQAMRKAFWTAYSAFVAAFRDAAELLKGGDRLAKFPVGSFPPRLPFVSLYATGPP
jgi:hypothetical protein